MTGMVTAVTGAAGHVGANLCVALRSDGHTVRAVDIRKPVRAIRHGAEWVRADVRDPAAMARALDGCEIVYHLAAVISIVGPLGGLVHSTNVDGTRVVAQAALDAGVRRLIHCSSCHAFDVAAMAGRPVDETAPPSVAADLPAYDRSKAAGEIEVRRVIDRGLDAVVVNPTSIVGPVDDLMSRVGSVLLALWRRRLPALCSGGFDWVDVRDVVYGLRSAAERGRTGENYLLGGHRCSVSELAQAAAAASGTPVVRRIAPPGLLRALSPVTERLVRLTGTSLLPTREAVLALESFPIFDISKARRELNYEPRPLAQTLADLHAFFVQTGKLPKPTAHTLKPAAVG